MAVAYDDVLRTALALRGYRLRHVAVGRHVFWRDWSLVTLYYEDGQGQACSGGDIFDASDLRDTHYLETWVDANFPDLLHPSSLLAEGYAAHQARLMLAGALG